MRYDISTWYVTDATTFMPFVVITRHEGWWQIDIGFWRTVYQIRMWRNR